MLQLSKKGKFIFITYLGRVLGEMDSCLYENSNEGNSNWCFRFLNNLIRFSLSVSLSLSLSIYIYMCVCVCVWVCARVSPQFLYLFYTKSNFIDVSLVQTFCELLLLLLLLLFTPWEFFTSLLSDGLSLKFERQQVSSSLQDSSHYSGRSQ